MFTMGYWDQKDLNTSPPVPTLTLYVILDKSLASLVITNYRNHSAGLWNFLMIQWGDMTGRFLFCKEPSDADHYYHLPPSSL